VTLEIDQCDNRVTVKGKALKNLDRAAFGLGPVLKGFQHERVERLGLSVCDLVKLRDEFLAPKFAQRSEDRTKRGVRRVTREGCGEGSGGPDVSIERPGNEGRGVHDK
jgi:hypothetical protein